MNRTLVSPALLGWLAALGLAGSTTDALSQAPPPPLPPPAFEDSGDEGEDEGDSDSDSVEPTGEETPAPVAESVDPAESAAPPPSEPWEQTVEPAAAVPTTGSEAPSDVETWMRASALRRMTTLSGSTGLHRVSEAGSGAPGTFRMNLLGSYFSGNGFLCTSSASCPDPVTQADSGEDQARHSDFVIAISATPFPFLEAFFSIHNSATKNTNGTPQVLEVVGDTRMGLKGFLPEEPDRVFGFGGEMDLHLVMGTGGVGPVGGATSLAIRGLGSLNFNQRSAEEDRIPLSVHLNLGYKIDNSSVVVRELEETPFSEGGRGKPIERTERYGLGISRVDAFEIGLGTEYINPYVRPFLEWTMDVPVNRQGYVCNIQDAASRGDECLGVAQGFATSPSRLTLGARVFPWQASGLALTAALDLGTSGTKRFLEETTPESPYAFWFGLGYAVDTVPPPPVFVEVAAPAGLGHETRRYILGSVVEINARAPVPHAIIRYDGVPMTGLVADAAGQFISQDLPPGEYHFKVFAEQFREGTCSVVIPETAPPLAEAGAAPAPAPAPAASSGSFDLPEENGAATSDAPGALAAAPAGSTAPYTDTDGTVMVPMECELKELPLVADVTGLLVDAETGGPVPDATVRITDKLNRSLELAVDAQGSFQFRNVPFGVARLTVRAPGYLATVAPMNIESRAELKPQLLMNRRPTKLELRVGKRDITLDRPIQFVTDQAEVSSDSMAMVEQLAAALEENPDLASIEIQVHTDDTGSASYSRRLSQQRADRVVEILTQLGINKRRLTARGFGPDQPLAPNVSEANRAKNNRVQIVIQ